MLVAQPGDTKQIKKPTTKRTALSQAVTKSLTGKTFKELFTQLLPALAVAGLVLPSVSMAGDYDFNASGGEGEIVANVVTEGTETAIGTDIPTDTNIYGMQGYDIAVEGANLNIEDSTLASVYGGYTDASGASTDNVLTIETSEIVGNIVAGVARGDGAVTGNEVTLTGSTVYNDKSEEGAAVVGGVSAGAGFVTGNTVTITGGSVDGSIAGGYAYGGDGIVSDNTVTLTDAKITVVGSLQDNDFVVGGYSTGKGVVTYNHIVMSGGSIEGSVYGGYGYGDGEVSSNTVEIEASDTGSAAVTGNIVGGVARGNASVSGNTVTLTGVTVSNESSKEGAAIVGGISLQVPDSLQVTPLR